MCKVSKFEFLSFFMCVVSIVVFQISFLFMMCNLSYLYEIELFFMNSIVFSTVVYLDWMAVMFMFIVLLISSLILNYSKVYMGKECHQFLWLTMLFICFMLVMIMSPSSLGVLLGWDGLGMISYCLIIYYKSSNSFNSGFITAATNRLGDSMLMVAIAWFSLDGLYLFFESSMTIFFVLACMTKSAQVPFNVWLPLAMAAPTPISSLVHSSTLVTAGVYLLIRFYFCYQSTFFVLILLICSLLTIFIAGISALKEFDMKRVIALSTLGQLGFMVLILCVGYPYIAFFHLLVHALFKALLFMCAGSIIHSSNGLQDLRKMGNMELDLILKSCINVSMFNLMGLPFTSGFYSKDTLLELIYFNFSGMGVGVLLLVLVSLTIAYTIRLIVYFSLGMWVVYTQVSWKMLLMIFILSLSNVVMGVFLNWMIQELYFTCVTTLVKLMPLIVVSIGVCWHGTLKLTQPMNSFVVNMLFTTNVTKMHSYLVVLSLKLLKVMDQGWFESCIFNLKKNTLKTSYYFSKTGFNYLSVGVMILVLYGL
uniref:NADH:ubiquinone reductase (H(+)-translocating) n=1 Tax=Pariaconus pele TaxID=1950172 RepID=A0A344A2M8_9HEMI|nr:NADH dehydrogenase subunit 5 [Pariaconus pele]AWU49019.1 NADH dehydrogenase subunit 5 [Pariaconus pele]